MFILLDSKSSSFCCCCFKPFFAIYDCKEKILDAFLHELLWCCSYLSTSLPAQHPSCLVLVGTFQFSSASHPSVSLCYLDVADRSLARWSTPPESSKAGEFQLDEKLKDEPVLSRERREEVSAGTLTVMSLADAGWEVITPYVYVASPSEELKGLPRHYLTFSHCHSLHTWLQWVKWFSHNHRVAESGPGLRPPDFWLSSLLIASCSFQD